jgi:methylenetetrahydrofolate dehydrogenase (NADP+)/methenyltetrahydrofolate cyclohydrolase
MSGRLLDGRALANQLRDDLRHRVDLLASRGGGPPRLAILGDGISEAATLYAASLDRAASRVGIGTELRLGGDEPIEDAIERLNADPAVAGIVIAQPFADAAEGRRLVQHVDPAKDVDGATPTNAGWLARGEPAFVPATALAVIALLEAYEVPIAGRRAVIVGRSAVVGRPVASLLLARDATVVVCHRATRDLARETRDAELLVAAAGVPRLITADMVAASATVIDCGINAVDGGIVGDVDTAAVAAVAEAISPVPGGVGPVTPMMVLRQTVEAAERASNSSA